MTAPSAPAIVPHTGFARMVRDVVSADAASIRARATIDPAHPLVVAGEAPAYLGIEIGAQAAAALAAASAETGASTDAVRGRLVRVRKATFARPTLPAGVDLDVTATCTGAHPPLASYVVTVSLAGVVIVTATISTYTLESAPA